LQPAPQAGPLPFRELAALYKERHVIGNHFTFARAIDYRLKPLLEHFGDRPIAEIQTADVQDFIADLLGSGASCTAEAKRDPWRTPQSILRSSCSDTC
jgi:hypothetical protein